MKYKHRLLPYELIVAASHGDICAVDSVLAHYRGYIVTLCKTHLYDAEGIPCVCINEDMMRTLETKLITKILTFNASA